MDIDAQLEMDMIAYGTSFEYRTKAGVRLYECAVQDIVDEDASIEQVREELRKAGIDTEPLKWFVREKIQELRRGR